jgi:linoleoyl-CoA desaturase
VATPRDTRVPRARFMGGGDFYRATRRDVDRYLALGGVRTRALAELWLKTILGFLVLAGAWGFLVFGHPSLRSALPALAGVIVGGIVLSVCVLHDANHGAYFRSRRANHFLGWMVDIVLGFGSYSWRIKHNLHHAYPNVDGYDVDIDHAPVARLAPSQSSRPWYRWQHRYIWALYAFALLRWHLTDLMNLRRSRGGRSNVARPAGWDLAGVVVGKTIFAVWVFVIPSLYHRWWVVLIFYFAFVTSASLFMAVIFQLAHCGETSEFISVEELGESPRVWAVHEVECTADFCQANLALTWFVGGLNFQIEHHLFPGLPHTLYPRIAPIVRENAERYGVRYTTHENLRLALWSHYSHLRTMASLNRKVEIEMG